MDDDSLFFILQRFAFRSLEYSYDKHKGISITYNINKSSYSAENKFTIWNAALDYRFLKGNQAEIKFSALDLLHQNKSIIDYGENNSLTIGNVNVLQQYFMVKPFNEVQGKPTYLEMLNTLLKSYWPRILMLVGLIKKQGLGE